MKQCFWPLFSLPTPFLLTFLHPPCSSFPLFHSLSSNNNSKLTSWLLMFQAAPTYSNCLFFYSQLLICLRCGCVGSVWNGIVWNGIFCWNLGRIARAGRKPEWKRDYQSLRVNSCLTFKLTDLVFRYSPGSGAEVFWKRRFWGHSLSLSWSSGTSGSNLNLRQQPRAGCHLLESVQYSRASSTSLYWRT